MLHCPTPKRSRSLREAPLHDLRNATILSDICNNKISPIDKSPLTSLKLNLFIRAHTQTLITIIHGNQFFGILLLSFIIIYIPINSYMIIRLVMAQFNPIQTFVFSNVIIFQYLFIFGFHLVAASYTSRIHKCRKLLFHWSAKLGNENNGIMSIGSKIRLLNYTIKFHCKRRYGILYGRYGLMTLMSFVKFILIYTQFIMYSYQLLEKFN